MILRQSEVQRDPKESFESLRVRRLSGEATVVEDAGDAACWPGGNPNAHQVLNKSGAPCSFVIVGTRLTSDTVRYPDLGRVLTYGNGRWQLRNESDGRLIKEGLEP